MPPRSKPGDRGDATTLVAQGSRKGSLPPTAQQGGTSSLAEPPGLSLGSVSKAGTELTAPRQHRPQPSSARKETTHPEQTGTESPQAAEPFKRHERTLASVLFDKPKAGDPWELQTAQLRLLPKEATHLIPGL